MKRRDFIKSIAVGTAVVSTTAVSSFARSEQSGSSTRNKNEFDVIVIGGGFAGITAARDISLSGASTLLLEARPRLGGRTFTAKFAGHDMDMGGTWFGWGQPNIWSEKSKYDLPIIESAAAAKATSFIWYDNGKRKEGTAEEYWPAVYEAYDKFYAPAYKYFSRPHDPLFHNSEEFRKLDQISARDAIEALNVSDLQKTFLRSFVSINGHSGSDKSSYLDQLRWFALSGFNKDFMWANLSQYKFKNGTSELIEHMLADSSAEVKLGSAAKHIEQTSSGVTVVVKHTRTPF